MPLMADIPVIPSRQKYWRCMVCHSIVASPQPQRPGSLVSTLTKIQLRMRACTTSVETLVISICLHRKYQESGQESHAVPQTGRNLQTITKAGASGCLP